jgi:proteic killer suppression protein
VIRSCANSATRRFHGEGNARWFRGLDVDTAHEHLASLDAAVTLADLGGLKSARLHKLSGNRAGQWSMTVNGRWRICFRFEKGDAHDVEIVDYHRG